MATCSRTILADENVTVSGNTFSCVGDIPVGVALFVEGIGGGGGGGDFDGGGGSGEYLNTFLGKTVDGILDITIGAGGASNGDGNDTIVKYDSKTIRITMNKGKKGEISKGGDGGSGAVGGPTGRPGEDGTGNPSSAGGGGGGRGAKGGNGGMGIDILTSPAKGGGGDANFGAGGGGGGGGEGGGGGGGGFFDGEGGAAASKGGGQKGDDGSKGGKGGNAGPNSGGGGGGGGGAGVGVGGKGGSGYVKYTWISKFLEITLTQTCYSETSTSIPIATVHNPTNLPLTVSIDWTPPFNSNPYIKDNNIIYSTIPLDGKGVITVTYTQDDVSYSETLKIETCFRDKIVFPCLISQPSSYMLLSVIYSSSSVENVIVCLGGVCIETFIQKIGFENLIYIKTPKKKGCYSGIIKSNLQSDSFILSIVNGKC